MTKKWLLPIVVALIPVIPLLYLYNQNAKFLNLAQVWIACGILAFLTVSLFFFFRAVLRSRTASFVTCLTMVILLFVCNGIYKLLVPDYARMVYLLPIPLGYIAGFLYNRLFHNKEFSNLPVLAAVVAGVMLVFNIFPILMRATRVETPLEIKYKTNYVVDQTTQTPNVYWILCDGMLGFDAMETYYGDKQESLTEALAERGFAIDQSAKFESGHWTRIAVPALMCPDYYDAYLSDIVSDHDQAVALREKTGTGLDNARKYNETIEAFRAKGYCTAAISVEGPYFYPTTDFYYYIKARYLTPPDYRTVPRLVENMHAIDVRFLESRLYAYQLGEILLGGLPGILYDKMHPRSNIVELKLKTAFDGASDVLLGAGNGKINTALVTSLYDTLYSPDLSSPKLVIAHDFLAHVPFDMDENGYQVADAENILSYHGQHTYAAKVLINLVDLILEADEGAVIVLQADHGLHSMTQEQITEAFGVDAVQDIWNSVFSAVRVPKQYQNGEEQYYLTNPLNISRYLVNSFVGRNYDYLEGSNEP